MRSKQHSNIAAFAWMALAFLAPMTGLASEPDNFTNRPTNPKDLSDTAALTALNDKTNALFEEALKRVPGCDLKRLHFAVKNTLAGGEVGKLENWAISNPALKKVIVPYDQSIYADSGITTGSVGLFLMGIVPSFMLGGHYVGADKLGHFFDQGYDYYEAIYVHHLDPFQALENLGLDDEDDLNGMSGNGIRAYADMATNFSGYLFWRQVAGGDNPYFKCEDGHYVRTSRKFDWGEYANDAWDEAYNCSEFSPSVGEGVKKRLTALGLSCPLSQAACQRIADLPCGATFLSPVCLSYVKIPTYPDAACRMLLDVDKSEASACRYESGFFRRHNVKVALDMQDGLQTIEKMRLKQFYNWQLKSARAAAGKAVKILDRLKP